MSIANFSNNMFAIGTLKNMEVNLTKTSKGTNLIGLRLTLVSHNGNNIHENIIDFSALDTEKSTTYKEYQNLAKTLKTQKDYGENADKLSIRGTLEINEYFNVKRNELLTSNKLRGSFINKIAGNDIADEVGAIVECIVTKIDDEIVDGVVTGRKRIGLLSVGYREDVVYEYQNVFVEKDMANSFMQFFPIGTVAEFHLRFNQYVVTNGGNSAGSLFWGNGLANANIVTRKVTELIIVGANNIQPERQLTQEQINTIIAIRESNKQQIIQNGLAQQQQQQGQGKIGMNNGLVNNVSRGTFNNMSTTTGTQTMSQLVNNPMNSIGNPMQMATPQTQQYSYEELPFNNNVQI